MTSRMPPVSPASIMLVLRSSKTLGNWRMAFARVAPPSTVVRTPLRVFWKVWFSWLAARISRHCTSGRPASIMTENWRKKIAMSLVLTLPDPNMGRENSLPFSRTEPGVMRSLRNCWRTTSLFAAVRSPEIFSPEELFPENVNTGMVNLSSVPYSLSGALLTPPEDFSAGLSTPSPPVWLTLCGSGRFRHSRRGARPVHQSGTTIDHFLQFVLIAGPQQSGFQGDLLLEVRGRERLVKGLHAELFLTGLHGGVDLVDLVFADQVADGCVGHHDFHAHRTAFAVSLGQQALTHDAFEHQRELRPDLGLLVSRKDVDDTVDGRRRRVGVQRAEGQVAGLGNTQGGLDGFQVAHFADQDHIGIFAECGPQRVADALGIGMQLALVHQAVLIHVYKFDRILNGEDVIVALGIDLVDHGRQRGWLSRSRGACDQHQPARPV